MTKAKPKQERPKIWNYGLTSKNQTTRDVEHFTIKKGSKIILYGQLDGWGDFKYPLECELLEDANAEFLQNGTKVKINNFKSNHAKNTKTWLSDIESLNRFDDHEQLEKINREIDRLEALRKKLSDK